MAFLRWVSVILEHRLLASQLSWTFAFSIRILSSPEQWHFDEKKTGLSWGSKASARLRFQASRKTITALGYTHWRVSSDTFKVASVYKSIQIDENFNFALDIESCFVNIVACGYEVIGSRYTNASKRRAYFLSFTSESKDFHATFSYIIVYCNHF